MDMVQKIKMNIDPVVSLTDKELLTFCSAFEPKSLFPMFFTGGYHVGLGYRYNHFRIRVSVINGGSYQFFLGRHIYLQPGMHIYLRGDNSADFNGTVYNIPNIDIAPVIRVGYRIWSRY